jgi:hypothetical protein
MGRDPRLCEVIAIEKGVKSRRHKELTDYYRVAGKADQFSGFSRVWDPKDEDSDMYPDESKKVVLTTDGLLRDVRENVTEVMDITATKDFGNCEATADVVVDEAVIVTDAPVTYLLFLEKQCIELRAVVTALPVLDDTYDWTWNETKGLYETAEQLSTKTKKVTKPVHIFQPTEHQPGQYEMVQEDVVQGTWHTVKQSGATTKEAKRRMLARIEKLEAAVKTAREEANAKSVKRMSIGEHVFNFLLGG